MRLDFGSPAGNGGTSARRASFFEKGSGFFGKSKSPSHPKNRRSTKTQPRSERLGLVPGAFAAFGAGRSAPSRGKSRERDRKAFRVCRKRKHTLRKHRTSPAAPLPGLFPSCCVKVRSTQRGYAFAPFSLPDEKIPRQGHTLTYSVFPKNSSGSQYPGKKTATHHHVAVSLCPFAVIFQKVSRHRRKRSVLDDG